MEPFAYSDSELDRLTPMARPTVTLRGSLLVFKNGECKNPPPIKEKGAIIKEFSRASRLRLLKFTATIKFRTIGKSLFLTLTYPDGSAWDDYTLRQQHKQLFLRKVEAYLDRQVCGLWRTEWEVRKTGACEGEIAPHFHLLIFNVRWIPWQLIRQWWKSVIHHDGYCRTECKRARGAKGCGHYVSKYVAKVPGERSLVNDLNQGAIGKHYGYIRPRKIPRHDKQEMAYPNLAELRLLCHYARAAMPWADIRFGESFTLLGRYAQACATGLMEMGIDNWHIVK